MRKTLSASFILAAFLFFFVSSSHAEIKAETYSIMPFIGVTHLKAMRIWNRKRFTASVLVTILRRNGVWRVLLIGCGRITLRT